MESKWVIYGLREKNTDEYRYIGMTSRGVLLRLKNHFHKSTTKWTKVYIWMREVGVENIEVDTLESTPEGDVQYIWETEQYWISQIRSFGHRLTNMTDGGGGVLGAHWSLSEETKQRQGIAKIGSLNPRYGKSPWNTGRKMTTSELKVRSESQTLLWKNIEYRTKMSEAHRGPRNESDETKAKRSAASKARSSEQSKIARKVAHTRWHTNRGIVNPDCFLCRNTDAIMG